MAITLKELLSGKNFSDQPKDIQDNLMVLLERVNKVREAWGKPMVVTSGLRTKEDQIRIYKQKGITDPNKIPMASKHLYGAAVDISDPDGSLAKWLKSNDKFELWYEEGTKGWVHMQCVPFGSYKPGRTRWFKP